MSLSQEDILRFAEDACSNLSLSLSNRKPLGKGSFGAVFIVLAKDGKLHALKISSKIRPPDKPIPLKYLRREAYIQADAVHKNLVRAFSSLETEYYIAIEMELCTMNLYEYRRRYGVLFEKSKNVLLPDKIILPEVKLRPLVREMLRGLAAMHLLGYCHRDIKPENILLLDDGHGNFTVKIADFGLSKEMVDPMITNLGTFKFMAPEVQASRPGHPVLYDERCDIWSLGVSLIEILIGDYPMYNARNPILTLPERPAFSDCLRHFINNLVIPDPNLRFRAVDALHHPFAMPKVTAVQLVQPDSSFGTLSGTLHKIELGDLAFRNALNKHSFAELSEMRPASKIKWEVSFKDIAAVCGVDNTEDTLCIASGGKVCHMNDPVTYSTDDDLDVLFVSNKRSIPRVDCSKIVEANSRALSEVDSKGTRLLFDELRARAKFCELMRQNTLPDFLKRVISFDELIKELDTQQNEVAQRVAGFPTVAFTEPTISDCKPFVPSAEEKDMLDSLKQALTDGLSPATAEKAADEMKLCTAVWMGSKPCSCMEHAAETFNNILEMVQRNVDAIVRLMDFIDIVKSAKGMATPQTVYPQLVRVVSGCPYFGCSESMKAILRIGNMQDIANSEVVSLESIVREQLREAQEMCDRERRAVESYLERNPKFLMESMRILNKYKKIITQLQDALISKGVKLPVYESEVEEK